MSPATTVAGTPTFARGKPISCQPAARPLAVPKIVTNQVPTLIAEVGLKTRSIRKKRSGRPRSEISSGGETAMPTRETAAARRARGTLPNRRDHMCSGAAAPESPPKKK